LVKAQSEYVRVVEILRSVYGSTDDVIRSLEILEKVVSQLDGRTLGLLAYNDWNSSPIRCSCPRELTSECPCGFKKFEEAEKWLSMAHNFNMPRLHAVVCVEVSDIAGYGLAFETPFLHEPFLRVWGGFDCDLLPDYVKRMLIELKKIAKEFEETK